MAASVTHDGLTEHAVYPLDKLQAQTQAPLTLSGTRKAVDMHTLARACQEQHRNSNGWNFFFEFEPFGLTDFKPNGRAATESGLGGGLQGLKG